MPADALFEQLVINKTKIPNRLVVAPMTRVSATYEGTVGPLMNAYYKRFAEGGFGLIITEGLYTDQMYSQGYLNQPGMALESHAGSWKKTTRGVQKAGSKIIAQLMHAGALSQYNRFTKETAGPSSVQPLGKQMPFYEGDGPFKLPREMNLKDIEEAVSGFANSAILAKEAGFDGVEIHGANGYLLDQFFTVYMNKRVDAYGGCLESRAHIYKRTIEAVRAAVGPDFIVGVRFSQKKVNDPVYNWPEGETAAEHVFKMVSDAGIDYIHTAEPMLNSPAFEGSKPLSALAKEYGGLPVIANGGIVHPGPAVEFIRQGFSDMVALGKTALANQDWPSRVRNGLHISEFDFSLLSPRANLQNAEKYTSQKVTA